MAGLEHAVKRIQALECPNGEVEERVSEILKEYDGTLENPATVRRDRSLDQDGAEGYSVALSREQDMVILTAVGMDDYVAKVVQAYIVTR